MLQNLLTVAFERGLKTIQKRWRSEVTGSDIQVLCAMLVSSRGEVSGGAIAARILNLFLSLSEHDRYNFFVILAQTMNPEPKNVIAAVAEYEKTQNPDTLSLLLKAVEPPRQELFRRLNLAPGGTVALVEMRRLLLKELFKNPEFSYIDQDMRHLFSSWFNRGFLVLKAIEWQTPAHILEKIIFYEAIHEIHDWQELRQRLLPEDRRCFGFFHPAMLDDPLIFVEVALMQNTPEAVCEVLNTPKKNVNSSQANTAVFYSISKCHDGLRGISFGNFLIKHVAQKLSQELPSLKNFVTLSPVPGLLVWLGKKSETSVDAQAVLAIIESPNWYDDLKIAEQAKLLLMPLVAEYFVYAKNSNELPIDAVARFHLGNGAVLKRINWLADSSAQRMKQSAGVMVNYDYVLDNTEDNHEAYARTGVVRISSEVKALLKEYTPKKVTKTK